jgi:hypothetical protein
MKCQFHASNECQCLLQHIDPSHPFRYSGVSVLCCLQIANTIVMSSGGTATDPQEGICRLCILSYYLKRSSIVNELTHLIVSMAMTCDLHKSSPCPCHSQYTGSASFTVRAPVTVVSLPFASSYIYSLLLPAFVSLSPTATC